MNPLDRERLAQELLEHHFGCHEEPERIEALLTASAEARALLAEVRTTAELLDAAARADTGPLRLRPPAPRSPFRRFLRVAAMIAILVNGLALGNWGWKSLVAARLERQGLHLVVSGPPALPEATVSRYELRTLDPEGRPRPARVHWRLLDADDREIDGGDLESQGRATLALDPRLETAGKLVFQARHGDTVEETTIPLRPGAGNPLLHLDLDRPIYRPGEILFIRALALNRVSLEPIDRPLHLRILNPKGNTVDEIRGASEEGVMGLAWQLPADAAGGRYRLEIRSAADDCALAGRSFEVRRFEKPLLRKTIVLDRQSYRPGESGRAAVRVERLAGGPAEGARVEAILVVDGRDQRLGTVLADGEGRASFDFEIPAEVDRGDARLVARIDDGAVVETGVQPFLVPTGRYDLDFYPEGGDLGLGLDNRVYFEARDPLGRPVSVRGRLVDDRGQAIMSVASRHQGRGLFGFRPEPGRAYRLETEDGQVFRLPAARAGALVLDTSGFEPDPDGRARVVLHGAGDGPYVIGLFCRGFLIASRTVDGPGEISADFDLPAEARGVLRVTVFDHELAPRAERLVHRRGREAIEVEIRPSRPEALPGDHQELTLVARDEKGRPVRALLGLTVTDQAVHDLASERAVGLADALSLCADVEELEKVETFLTGPQAEENVDLLLGSRGWRRFAWREPEELVDRSGERGRNLLAREGRTGPPRVGEARNPAWLEMFRSRRAASEAWTGFVLLFLLCAFAFLLLGLGRLGWWLGPAPAGPDAPRSLDPKPAGRGLLLRMTMALLVPALPIGLVVIALVNALGTSGGGISGIPRAFAPGDALEAEAHDLVGDGFQDDPVEVDEEVAFIDEPDTATAIPGGWGGGGAGRGGVNGFGVDVSDFGIAVSDFERVPTTEVDQGQFSDPDFRYRLPGPQWLRVYAHRRGSPDRAERRDFSETLYWNPRLLTDEQGEARVAFDLADSVTTWTARVDAQGAGRVGQAELRFDSVLPLSCSLQVPIAVSADDHYLLPITVVSRRPGDDLAEVEVLDLEGALVREGPARFPVPLDQGRGRAFLALRIGDGSGRARLHLAVSCKGERDELSRELWIARRGFPRHLSRSGLLEGSARVSFALPEDCPIEGMTAGLAIYPSVLATLQTGLESMLQEPHGCFEQTSSTNYPNVMALQVMESCGQVRPEVAARARDLLVRGYRRLVGFECTRRGYEWFGDDPAHLGLSAYGLLEFHDMRRYVRVDEEMMARTRDWLLSRRDGQGGYRPDERALDGFGHAPKATTDAYVTYALARTGTEAADIARELDRLAERAQESEDAYEIALAARALEFAGRRPEADGARERLKGLRDADGHYRGRASITRSGRDDLAVETTALAVLAFLDDPQDLAQALSGLRYLLSRSSGGRFGSTQATVLTLEALAGFARRGGAPTGAGEVRVIVNGEEIARRSLAGDLARPLTVADLGAHLRRGANELRIEGPGDQKLPWAFDLHYFAEKPANDPDCPLELRADLARTRLREGETVALEIRLRNRSGEGLPMTMAAIGLPGNLELPTAVLDDLKKAGRFDYWERRDRDLVLYWRELAPEASERLVLDCVAKTPGLARGAASRCWLYYSPQDTFWLRPLEVEVVAD
ncbi:MAG: hypothetical protein H6807_08965 [Planctomycetes bacterium]|nr:hypothetical protein [Planctomycetota bacterium]